MLRPPLEARDESGAAPLHLAAEKSKNPEVVLKLLELGADPKAKTNSGLTPWNLIQQNEKAKLRLAMARQGLYDVNRNGPAVFAHPGPGITWIGGDTHRA